MSSLSSADAGTMTQALHQTSNKPGAARYFDDSPKRLEGLLALSQELRDYARRKAELADQMRGMTASA